MGALLDVERFAVAYGPAPVVRDVSFSLRPGEIMALLGRNGMGKTTLLRGLLGLAPVRKGSALFAGIADRRVADRNDFARRHRLCARGPRNLRQSDGARKSRDERARRRRRSRMDARARADVVSAPRRAHQVTAAASSPAASSKCSPSAAR